MSLSRSIGDGGLDRGGSSNGHVASGRGLAGAAFDATPALDGSRLGLTPPLVRVQRSIGVRDGLLTVT